jgi:cell division protein FtsI (penicillin-binding protein 3)
VGAPPLSPSVSAEGGSPARERAVRFRLMIVGLSVSLWSLGIGVRLLQLQVLNRASFERMAARQSERTINLDPRRGAILDRNGRPLAVSVDAESIYAVPQDLESPARSAAALGRALDLDASGRKDLLALLQKNRAFVWVKRKVDPATARAVRDLSLPGIGFVSENRRYYPKRELASQVLGYVGMDNTGMSGIEYAFEDAIKGRPAKVLVETDARRRPVSHTERPSTDGSTIVLTIDEAIQHTAESELERAVNETQSVAGMVVVMDPRTGEVLALANRPTFNPNRFAAYSSARWRNRAVTDAYEPGSMFKIFTAAAALQEKVVTPEEVIDCGGGSIDISGTRINDHHVFYDLSFRDVIAHSSDIGVIRVAQRLGRENFYKYMRDFGFGAQTHVDLPGESTGLLRPTNKWSALSLPTLSFGQEIGVTALQMATAVSAVANGGYLMKPLVVREVEDSEGRIVSTTRPEAVRRVLEPETVDTLTDLLRSVVTSGTGKRAAIPGYAVAGKTGTAQKVDAQGRYSMIDHVASFVGFAPAARPALVVLVSLDTPKGPRNEGGDVAAPLFARVMEQSLQYLAVPPDDTERVLRMVPFRPHVTPAAYRPALDDLPTTPPDPADGDEHLMPDLRGRSAREAAIAAARRGLIVELSGSGQVVSQQPDPGMEIDTGQKCVLSLGSQP